MNVSYSQKGFTLVEMIVSLAIFSIVVTVSVGALLVLVATNTQLQSEQSVMTNLSFALDSMTREIRTGTGYFCDSHPTSAPPASIFNNTSNLDTVIGSSVSDCARGNFANHRFHGVSFIEGGDSITNGSQRILYFFDSTAKKIYRRVGSNPAESIVSSGIVIEELEFFVSGTAPQTTCFPAARACADSVIDQPTITLFIKATDVRSPTAKPYYLQTTITQRTLDV